MFQMLENLLRLRHHRHLDLILIDELERNIKSLSEIKDTLETQHFVSLSQFQYTQSENQKYKSSKSKVLNEFLIKDKFIVYKEENVKGIINELVIISYSPNFRLYVEIDREKFLNDNFTDLQGISEYSDFLDAYVSGEFYIIRLRDLKYTENIEITLYGENVKIKKLILFYEIK